MEDDEPKKRRRVSAPSRMITPSGAWERRPDAPKSRSGRDATRPEVEMDVHQALWVLLMFDELDLTLNTTSIHVSKIPASAVAQFNTGKRELRKNTKNRKREWKLEQWIGPFISRDEARVFAGRWARSQCALYARVMRGAELARDYKPVPLNVYTFHKQQLIEELTPTNTQPKKLFLKMNN